MLLTSYFDLLLEKIQKLTKLKTFGLLLLFLIIVIFINGISLVPPEQYQRLSENPFTTRTDISKKNYWQETVLLPILAYYTQLNSNVSFNILCFLIFFIAYFLFANLTFKRYGSPATLIFTTCLITSSLTTVILSWLGTPDSLTFALVMPFLFISSTSMVFLLALLGTMNHTVFIIAAIEILFLRLLSRDKINLRHLLSAILGAVIGYVCVNLFLKFNNIHITISRLDFILSKDIRIWIDMNANNFPISIFSLFNIQWLIILISLMMFFKTDKAYYSSLIIILLFNYGITFFTEDTTRIFSLLSYGILAECIFHSYKLALNKDDKEISYQKQYLLALLIIGFTSFISPRYYSWNGNIHTTPFYEFIRQIIK